jgi:hypothetical protein
MRFLKDTRVSLVLPNMNDALAGTGACSNAASQRCPHRWRRPSSIALSRTSARYN